MNPINWIWIGKAVQYFVDNEYDYKEVPWIVNDQAINMTLPPGISAFGLSHPRLAPGFLVGSAEQSFIQLMLNGHLSKGKYCAASPCFRDELVDRWNHLTFFKVELIEVSPNSQNVFEIMDCARAFMEELGNCQIEIIKTLDGYDLTNKGIEIGSYGYREVNNLSWTYGTGLALPRFSQTLEYVPEVEVDPFVARAAQPVPGVRYPPHNDLEIYYRALDWAE